MQILAADWSAASQSDNLAHSFSNRSSYNFCTSQKRTVSTRRGSVIRPRMSVQEYIDKHELSRKVEEVINLCVKAKPDEPMSYMVSGPEYDADFSCKVAMLGQAASAQGVSCVVVSRLLAGCSRPLSAACPLPRSQK